MGEFWYWALLIPDFLALEERVLSGAHSALLEELVYRVDRSSFHVSRFFGTFDSDLIVSTSLESMHSTFLFFHTC